MYIDIIDGHIIVAHTDSVVICHTQLQMTTGCTCRIQYDDDTFRNGRGTDTPLSVIGQQGAAGPTGAARTPRLTSMQRKAASRGPASLVLELCCGGDHSRSATALDQGKTRDSKLFSSTPSPHMSTCTGQHSKAQTNRPTDQQCAHVHSVSARRRVRSNPSVCSVNK